MGELFDLARERYAAAKPATAREGVKSPLFWYGLLIAVAIAGLFAWGVLWLLTR